MSKAPFAGPASSTAVVAGRPKSARGGGAGGRGSTSSALTPSFAHSPMMRWQSAGDAVVAVQRLRKAEDAQQGKGGALVDISDGAGGGGQTANNNKLVANDKLQLSSAQKLAEKKAAAEADGMKLTARYAKACHNSAKMGDPAALARYLQAHPKAADWADENRVTPLLMATAYGHLPCVEVLCGYDVNVDQKNVWGSTPLINAAHNAHHAVVHFLILHGAQTTIADKDGTALDGALKRLCRMMRGVVAATDDKHPDKPGLEAAKTELDFLGKQTNRGPIWHKKLEAAFVPLRPLLSQAPFAAANLALGKVEVPAAGPAAPGGAPAAGGKKEKAADDPDAPDAGRAALYAGLAAFIRCIEMLRDPKSVRAMERLRVGSGGEDAAENPADGLTQKVGRIRAALGIDVSATLPDAIKQANRAMGFDERGSLPEQAARLITALGLQ